MFCLLYMYSPFFFTPTTWQCVSCVCAEELFCLDPHKNPKHLSSSDIEAPIMLISLAFPRAKKTKTWSKHSKHSKQTRSFALYIKGLHGGAGTARQAGWGAGAKHLFTDRLHAAYRFLPASARGRCIFFHGVYIIQKTCFLVVTMLCYRSLGGYVVRRPQSCQPTGCKQCLSGE